MNKRRWWLRLLYPDLTELGWRPVRFQPLVMIAMFFTGVILIFVHTQDQSLGLPIGLWEVILILTPILGLASSGMALQGSGHVKSWGYGLRLLADVWSAIAVWFYIATRLMVETYVMSGCILVAVGVFSLAILRRDVQALRSERRSLPQEVGSG